MLKRRTFLQVMKTGTCLQGVSKDVDGIGCVDCQREIALIDDEVGS